MMVTHARRSVLLAKVSQCFSQEVRNFDLEAPVPSAAWPTISRLVDHLGGIYLWGAGIASSGETADRRQVPAAPEKDLVVWFDECRNTLLVALNEADPERPCWTLVNSAGTTAFWTRRMLFETTKHLIDIRASGQATLAPASELDAATYADGIDELLEVFLSRSRKHLAPLPRPLVLSAIDVDRQWTLSEDWQLLDSAPAQSTRVSAHCEDLALFVWERADPARAPERFLIEGPIDAVNAFAASPVHPST
ncbi:maleylpyruvate isomerase N-terminal domain-containing protein [Salinibacterium sp. TMP30]|uniref:maleylpyruvate isomerase N-terminal domain-containing protein n=1 Tax=Salinibacterium sp. TMP30 TaxID=3138237 RepID=UPI0031392F24